MVLQIAYIALSFRLPAFGRGNRSSDKGEKNIMMSLTLSHRVEQRITQRLTQSQGLAIDIAQLQLRRDLTDTIHGEEYKPRAECLKCGYQLTDLEIMKGFNDDPRDYTTCCPKCNDRFEPALVHKTVSGSVQRAFYCPLQTLDRLRDLVQTPLEELMGNKHASVYYSAIAHFGGIKQAFKRLGLTYAFASDLDWKKAIGPFLGKMADSVIAEIVGSSSSAIRRLRQRAGAPAYNRRREAAELAAAE